MGAEAEKPISDRVVLRPQEAASHAAFPAAPPLDGRHEFLMESRKRHVRSRSFHVDNQITGLPYKILVVSKYLAQGALYPVPKNRGTHLSRYGHSEAAMGQSVQHQVEDEVGPVNSICGAVDSQIFPGVVKSLRVRKPKPLQPLADRDLRPFVLLRLSTMRPPRVPMRVLNPCVFRRRRLFG